MKWNHDFDIREDWQKANKREISVRDFSKLIADKITNSAFFKNRDIELTDTITEFNCLGENASWDDFDVCLGLIL